MCVIEGERNREGDEESEEKEAFPRTEGERTTSQGADWRPPEAAATNRCVCACVSVCMHMCVCVVESW